jgi:hypothetical protein
MLDTSPVLPGPHIARHLEFETAIVEADEADPNSKRTSRESHEKSRESWEEVT